MKKKLGWGMLGFLIFLLLCGLTVPLGLVGEWWYSAISVCGVLFLVCFVIVASALIDSKE